MDLEIANLTVTKIIRELINNAYENDFDFQKIYLNKLLRNYKRKYNEHSNG